jgi:hypothetical protein
MEILVTAITILASIFRRPIFILSTALAAKIAKWDRIEAEATSHGGIRVVAERKRGSPTDEPPTTVHPSPK